MMPYNAYTYEHVNMGACSIQSALDVLKKEDKQQFPDTLNNGIVFLVMVWKSHV